MTNKNIIIYVGITLLIFESITLIFLAIITTDLRDTVQMYTNSLEVCRIDLEEVQKENESLRKKIEELR